MRAEDGLTLVEVLVSMMLVGLIALSFLGLDAAGRTTADQRRVSQATQIAQADQERLRGMSADQLATLSQSRTVNLDGVAYTVDSLGKYQSSSLSGDSCASSASAADYAKVKSTVTWGLPPNQKSVYAQSLITPRVGGSLVVQAQDQGAAGIAGATVTATGTDTDNSGIVRGGTTDAGGCVIFGSLPVGAYSVKTQLTGYLDAAGSATPTSNVTTTSGSTTNLTVRLAQPGKITGNFKGVIGSTLYTGSAPAMSWTNSNMSTPGVYDPSADNNLQLATPQTLFPYIVGTTTTNFTGNYTVYGGRCASAQPPVANQSTATVSPGSSVTINVNEPVMNITATYPNSSTPVKPWHIKLTHTGCSDSWYGDIRSSSSPDATTGWLEEPGQPYGNYSVCVDYKFQGTSTTNSANFKKATGSLSNTSFTSANSIAFNMNAFTGTGFC
jgi:Tfp pilus assembly protein PilV